jgi:hypothetical protein
MKIHVYSLVFALFYSAVLFSPVSRAEDLIPPTSGFENYCGATYVIPPTNGIPNASDAYCIVTWEECKAPRVPVLTEETTLQNGKKVITCQCECGMAPAN